MKYTFNFKYKKLAGYFEVEALSQDEALTLAWIKLKSIVRDKLDEELTSYTPGMLQQQNSTPVRGSGSPYEKELKQATRSKWYGIDIAAAVLLLVALMLLINKCQGQEPKNTVTYSAMFYYSRDSTQVWVYNTRQYINLMYNSRQARRNLDSMLIVDRATDTLVSRQVTPLGRYPRPGVLNFFRRLFAQ